MEAGDKPKKQAGKGKHKKESTRIQRRKRRKSIGPEILLRRLLCLKGKKANCDSMFLSPILEIIIITCGNHHAVGATFVLLRTQCILLMLGTLVLTCKGAYTLG